MAARSKKRLPKIENKLLKLDKLRLHDVICSICQSILVEPVTLPCYHDFCLSCFNGSIENNALCCPLCRLRIGSWLRTTAKQRSLVNTQLWKFLQTKFSSEIDTKHKGHDIEVPEDKPNLRISAPGEIRLEYEAEIKRLQSENLEIEQKHLKDTELLIEKLQREEEAAHKKYLETLQKDEILAKKLQQSTSGKPSRTKASNTRLKPGTIDIFLRKQNTKIVKEPNVKGSPLLTEDNSSSDSRVAQPAAPPAASPEVAPSYGRSVKNFIDKKVKTITGIWNKENGRNVSKTDAEAKSNDVSIKKVNTKDAKAVVHSLPVSLPYSGVLQHKLNLLTARNADTGSADSMHQELCYFKPIDGSITTSFKSGSGLPVRVPCVRAPPRSPPPAPSAPAAADYLHGLLRLRSRPPTDPAPSAFVVALKLLWTNNISPSKSDNKSKSKGKKITRSNSQKCLDRANGNLVDGDGGADPGVAPLRRTRSMKSFPTTNETTPKKVKVVRKAFSERKRLLRSDSKKLSLDSDFNESINNNKVKAVVKDLSSPLAKCDVKKILEEQLRIERMIEQEKRDLALARAVDEQVNGRRQPRRAAHKRLAPPAPRPAKKIKV